MNTFPNVFSKGRSTDRLMTDYSSFFTLEAICLVAFPEFTVAFVLFSILLEQEGLCRGTCVPTTTWSFAE
jgi:hypothetical protein